MAARKLASVVIVLMMLTSGVALTASAEETSAPPLVEANDSTPTSDDDVFIVDPPADMDLGPVPDYQDVESVPLTTPDKERPLYPSLDVDIPDDLEDFELNLEWGKEGGRLIRGDYDDRADPKVLLIDDDNSDDTNTTSEYDNEGPYTMDTGKIFSDALTAKNVEHDLYLVENGSLGPDYHTMTNYTCLIWVFGYEWGFQPTLFTQDYWRVRAFMEAGGAVWFVGHSFIDNLYGRRNYTASENSAFPDDTFANEYLGIREHWTWTGLPGTLNHTSNAIMLGSETYTTRSYFHQFGVDTRLEASVNTPNTGIGAFKVQMGDSTSPWGKDFDDASVCVAYDSGTWRVVTSSVDVANINDAADREEFVGKVMSWLGPPSSISLPSHSMHVYGFRITEQHPVWTGQWNYATYGAYTDLYRGIGATVYTHKTVDFKTMFENQGTSNENNFDIKWIVLNADGDEITNFTSQASVNSRRMGEASNSFKFTRSGIYLLFANITLSGDPEPMNNQLGQMLVASEWMDDLENGTSEWTKQGAWTLDDDAANSVTTPHTWYFTKSPGTTNGDELLTPEVDLRFYDTGSQIPSALTQAFGWTNLITLNFLFQGRLFGTGQDSVELLMHASNMSAGSWRQLQKWDGNTQVQGQANGDFSNGWYYLGFGIYLGDYVGQKVQFKWKFVKGSQFSNSWWRMDDFQVWMHKERNEPPWFIEKYPAERLVEVDVGTSIDLKFFAEDQTMDEPITWEWYEADVLKPSWIANETTLDIPQTVPPGDMYERGKTVRISVKVYDDLDFNDTYWDLKLMDPKPEVVTAPSSITIDEDVELDVDFGTSSNVKWFKDPEDQTFTVSSMGSDNIKVTDKGNNVLGIVNKLPDWYGRENITLKVKDSADSMLNYTLEVIVEPVNDPPKWKPVVLPDGEQDQYYSFNLTATDVDNLEEELSYSDDFEYFDISDSAEIAFVPTNDHVGYNYFNVTVEDPDGLNATMDLVLFVVNVNDPPRLIYIPPQYADEDEIWTLDVSEYVEDPDLLLPDEFKDHITYRDDTPKLDTNLETGLVTWDVPTNEDVGDFYFKITIQDSKGRYAEQEISITVNNTNDAPEIGNIPRQVLNEDDLYTYNIPFSDDDLDLENSEEELVFSNTHTDLFTIDAVTGRIQFTPENKHVGEWHVNITVMDIDGASDTKMVIFEVLNENDPPEIEYIRAQDLTEDVPYNFTVTATDPDMEPRLVDGLAADPDEKLTFRTNSTVVPIDPQTGEISLTPGDDDIGSYMVKITVVDRDSTPYTIDVLFNIENVNDPPSDLGIVGLVAGQTYNGDKKYQLMAQAKDIDNPEDQLTYMWYEGTTLIGQTKNIEWQPKGKGMTEMKLVVSDPDGGESAFNLTVNLKQPEDSPGFTTAVGVLAMALVGVMAVEARRRRLS